MWSRPLRVQSYRSACLSAANGNRIAEAVKVVRKIEADRGGHVGRYSMTEEGGCQDVECKSAASGKKAFLLLLIISILEVAIFLLWYIFWL